MTAQPHGTRVDVVCYADVAMAVAAPDLGALRVHAPSRPQPGFVPGAWLIVATVAGALVGCARVKPTPVPFPGDRPSAALSTDEQNEWLAGRLELVELVVHPEVHGYGVGSLLEATARSLAREDRCWAVLTGAERAALRFFRARGWVAVTEAGPGGDAPVVLLSPSHPAGPDRSACDGVRPPRRGLAP